MFILVYTISQKRYRDRRFWIKLASSLLIIVIVVSPIGIQHLKVRQEIDFSRKIGAYAAITSYLSAPPINRLYGKLTRFAWRSEGELFPGIIAFCLGLMGIVSSAKFGRKQKSISSDKAKPPRIYMAILILAFLFTFGRHGPYLLLYKYVPGFDTVRVAARFHIFVMFSLAVFAAFGITGLSSRLARRTRPLVTIVLLILILTEYLSIPLPLFSVPQKNQIPDVYHWLAKNKPADFALVELPLPPPESQRVGSIECPRLYYSIYHWKRMINGYSGYFPPVYDELRRRWQQRPVKQNIKDLAELGVRYVIIHASDYEKNELNKLTSEILALPDDIRSVCQFGEDLVYELTKWSEISPTILGHDKFKPLLKKDWKVSANVNGDQAHFAIDGSKKTRWETGPQRKGHTLQLDLARVQRIRGLSLKLEKSVLDYPRGYVVELSYDGTRWAQVAREENTILPITSFLKPKDIALNIYFSPQEARYIKIMNTGEEKIYYWSVYEVDVFE